MRRVRVRSSNVAEIGWEPAAGGTLEVLFRSGALYRYGGVPVHVALAVVAGEIDGSVGRTFDRMVRGAGYAYARVR